jgi:exoribonuclease-2
MQPGTIVAYRERGRLALGIVEKVTLPPAKAQVELIGEDGKKSVLALDRVLFESRNTISLSLPQVDLKKRLQELRDQISTTAQTIDLRELWELIREETDAEFSWEELSGYLLSSTDPAFAKLGVLDALLSQNLYFKEKKVGAFTPRDEDSIADIIRQQHLEQERARAQQAFFAWAKNRLAAPETAPPLPAGTERYLEPLKGFALQGDLYDKKLQAQKFIEEIGFRGKGHPWEVAFQLLVALGIWEPDEELSVLRYQIPSRFPAEVLEAAVATPAFLPGQPGYEDFTSLFTFTIDDADTTEVDDALSVEDRDGATRIGIHITDVGYFVPPDSIIDKAALARGTTIYLPRGKLPMLPSLLSDDKASLVEGQVRPTLSFFGTLDANGRIVAEQIQRGFIKVGKRLSYSETDSLLRSEEGNSLSAALRKLHQLAQTRKTLRISQGAIVIEGDEMKIKVDNGEITATLLPNDSPSRLLVGECMIFANEMAARYCCDRNLPALYIAQPPPDEPVPPAASFPTPRVYVHAARRLMKPSQIGITPAPHAALGLEVYTQVTSPLRRYHDLQMHHQIKHHLEHSAPLFNSERLQMIAANTQESSSAAKRCERESSRYWLLRLLETRKGQTVSGHVVREYNGRSFIELDDTLLVVPVTTTPPLPLGSAVQVVINHVDARRDVLSVRLADAVQ